VQQSETRNHQILLFQNGYLAIAAEAFLTDRKASGKTAGTVRNYRDELRKFITYCDAQAVKYIHELTADLLRRFLLSLAETHNAGGVHAYYRTLRAFLRWIEFEEVMPPEWRNPIRKVKPPKVPEHILEPVGLEDVNALIDACRSGKHAERDKAVFLLLLDTGVRARELCNINLSDVDMGTITIQKSKSGKPRTVYFGRKTRRAMRAYLRTRKDNHPALFVTEHGDRLSYAGLREILRRRARDAGIAEPTLHQFRRAFALNYLRNGGDVFTLQKLMGHSDLSVLKRYLKLTDQDAQIAHSKYSPVDRL
jgi:site-specific recombinase XerD